MAEPLEPPATEPRLRPAAAAQLSPEDAYRLLGDHPGWVVERQRIYRDYRFPSFRHAMDFVIKVADIAEAQGHHPNILLHEWCFVRLEVYSHYNDCLTRADVDLAIAIDEGAPV